MVITPRSKIFLAIKEIQPYTNVIPLLAKGDSFEKPELKKVKSNIVEMAQKQKVEFFDVVSTIDDIRNETQRNLIKQECLTDHALAPCPPFAIINPSHIK